MISDGMSRSLRKEFVTGLIVCYPWGGRVTLIIYVLSGIRVYWLSQTSIPASIMKALKQKNLIFLWIGSDAGKKMHLVN